ncbi:MAG: 30S ribosomal protein S21 [Phycisphaerales bacterium]|nr:MAG: 30S ribosomal protein S21 [Phycisphaerales bacterium]
MAIRIKSRQNESVGQMLRRFKKLCEKEGLTKDIKRKQYFEKPSERRRRAQRKAAQRLARVQSPRPPRTPVGRGPRGQQQRPTR